MYGYLFIAWLVQWLAHSWGLESGIVPNILEIDEKNFKFLM